FLSYASPDPPQLHSFPTRRSSDLDGTPVIDAYLLAVGGHPQRYPDDAVVVSLLSEGEVVGALMGIPVVSPDDSDVPPFRSYEVRSEEHTSELQSRFDLVCRLLLEK